MTLQDFSEYKFNFNTLVKTFKSDEWQEIASVDFERRSIELKNGGVYDIQLIKDIKS